MTSERNMPRWVLASLIIGLLAILLFVVVQLISGGEHGPGRHGGGDLRRSSMVHRPIGAQ